tara:strand:- start:189 stop:1196 length:1008 start_codon:yes stop_codon:yes gene_type:complete
MIFKKILILQLLILLFSIKIEAQLGLSDQYFSSISDVYFDHMNRPIIVQEDGDFHVIQYDESGSKILDRYVPDGRGPGESELIESSFYNKEENNLYLKSSDGSILIYQQGILLGQFNSGMKGRATGMTIYKQKLILSSQLTVTSEMLEEDGELIIASVLDLKAQTLEKEIKIKVSELGLNNIRNLNKVRYFFLNTSIQLLYENTYAIVIQGIPYIYIYKDYELISKQNLDYPSNNKIFVKEHNLYGFGVQIPALGNNFQKINETDFLITYGNSSQNIGFGFLYLFYEKNDDKLEIIEDVSVNGIQDINTLKLKTYDNYYFIFDYISRFATSIFIQ